MYKEMSFFHKIFYGITAVFIAWLGYTHVQIGAYQSGLGTIAYSMIFWWVTTDD